MRITGGSWRGRRLETVRGLAVRPTADRVREALFNILGRTVAGASVVDLCCGSGALGLEALSRAAARVDFVDVSPRSLAAVRENLERLACPEDRWRLHRADAVRWLVRRLETSTAPMLILADPPYAGPVATGLVQAVLAAGPAPIATLVLEHPIEANPVPASLNPAWSLDTRHYGRTALSLLRPAPEPGRTEAPHA
jgi:16S rRNA (guanine966-N2)-methyltransferase